MADKSIDQLNEAEKIYATDLFVLQQSGSAKKLTGQVLLNWLTAAADGHGGIQSIEKLSTSGLVDTYRITLADTTTFDFVVNNGRGITGISKTSTSGLVDTYTISYNNSTTSTFTVKNGEKGATGAAAYIWIKYASQKPTESSHSIGDVPDNWIGIYSGTSSSAPTDWKQYKWYKIKGEQGNKGDPATLVNSEVVYQVSDSGTIIPSGNWSDSVPVVGQGKYLWTRTTSQFNTGDSIVAYSVARMGKDGAGSVSMVNNVSPDSSGNVKLTAADVGALPSSGGGMTGAINMNGQKITGLNDPTGDTEAARKGYVDGSVKKAAPRNLLDNSDFKNPVNQRGNTSYNALGYGVDRWKTPSENLLVSLTGSGLSITNNHATTNYSFHQIIGDNLVQPGKTYTLAIKTEDGIYCGTEQAKSDNFSGSVFSVGDIGYIKFEKTNAGYRFNLSVKPNTTANVEWAALYEGEYTSETLPDYQPKGYAAELLECQRYYYKIENSAVAAFAGYIFAAELARMTIMLPVKMRANPTVTISDVSKLDTYTAEGNVIPTDYSTISAMNNQVVVLALTIPSGKKVNTPTVTRVNTVIEISADL